MEEIIKERARLHLFYLNIAAIPLWLVWILFDLMFAGDMFVPFIFTRIGGSLLSLFLVANYYKKWMGTYTSQIFMFAYYNGIIGYYIATVPFDSLTAYFNGYSMIMIIMFFILIMRLKDILWFTLMVVICFPFIGLFGNHSLNDLFAGGGFAFITVLVTMNFFGILRYKGVLRDLSLTAEIERARETEKTNQILEQANKEKETLLKEIHHRVKNNLQVISSILRLQSSYVKDPSTLRILEESQQRILSMSMIHETLYKSNNFASINMANYFNELLEELINSYQQRSDLIIHLDKKIDDTHLILDQAIPCGLIVNEVITNTLKYAFKDRNEGTIKIHFSELGNNYLLEIGDNGMGFPDNFNIDEPDTLGVQLILTLSEQLDGKLEMNQANGLMYSLQFPKKIN
jgi:two-component sensor histidine kinase